MNLPTDVVNLAGRVVTSEDSMNFGLNLIAKAVTLLNSCVDNSTDPAEPVKGAFACIPNMDKLELEQILTALADSIRGTIEAVSEERLAQMYITAAVIHRRWPIIVEALRTFYEWDLALLKTSHAEHNRTFDASKLPNYKETAQTLAKLFQPQA